MGILFDHGVRQTQLYSDIYRKNRIVLGLLSPEIMVQMSDMQR